MQLLRRIFLLLLIGFVVFLMAAQIASGFLLKPILERQGRRILQVPIYMEQAGTNLLAGSFWMKGVRIKNPKGFEDRDFLSARTISIDFDLPSLLTSEFSVSRILLKDPVFFFETNQADEFNGAWFTDRLLSRFERVIDAQPKLLHFITRYILEKFAVRNGTIRFINQQKPDQNWALNAVSFSLARVVYPPDPEEALPVAVYINATVSGESEGKILVLGRLNPFASKKSFDITGSVKGLAFSQYNGFVPAFPLAFAQGTLQLKVKALCHENQVDIFHQVHIENLKFEAKALAKPKKKEKKQEPILAFGLSPETVEHFFNDIQPSIGPFDFDFGVRGDLGDPNFNIPSAVEKRIHEIIYDRVTRELAAIEEKARKISEGDTSALS